MPAFGQGPLKQGRSGRTDPLLARPEAGFPEKTCLLAQEYKRIVRLCWL